MNYYSMEVIDDDIYDHHEVVLIITNDERYIIEVWMKAAISTMYSAVLL